MSDSTPTIDDNGLQTRIKRIIGRPFEVGNPGGPGRPKGSAIAKAIMLEAAPEVAQMVATMAVGGDIRACDLLLSKVLPALTKGEVELNTKAPLAEALKIVVKDDGSTSIAGGS
jgi:hypothetical protein